MAIEVTRSMVRPVAFAWALALVVAVHPAWAETRVEVAAGGGLPALDVQVDLAASVVRAGRLQIPIALDREKLPEGGAVEVRAIPIGKGRHVVHVRVPAVRSGSMAWEAILGGGLAEPIFAGLTGYFNGDPGERTGKAVTVVPSGDTSFVLVGDIRENLTICGQSATLLDPMAVYPSSLELRPATFQRLPLEVRDEATDIVAAPLGHGLDAPLEKLLVAQGTSVSGASADALTDGDVTTTWTEERPGAGQGEFVVMAAPQSVPISRLEVTISPPDPTSFPNGAAPKTFYLVTQTDTFRVTMPDDAWQKRAQAFQIALPHPVSTACLALVLGEGASPRSAHPDVTVSELAAYSEFDGSGKSLDDVATGLSGDRSRAAAAVLERAGDAALAAVERAYDTLDIQGKALAMDVGAAHSACEDAAPLFARGLCESRGQASRKAREKLGRCPGSATFLAKKLVEDASTRSCVAPVLASIAPTAALIPLADAMNRSAGESRETRAALRSAFAQSLDGGSRRLLAALLSDPSRSEHAKLEMLRAAGRRVVDVQPESRAFLTELWSRPQPMPTRYLGLEPTVALARAGDVSAEQRLAEVIEHDVDWPVRARAAELMAGESFGSAALQAALVDAERDREPRVRQAALSALGAGSAPGSVARAQSLLETDEWPFVRQQAVVLLSRSPASLDVDLSLAEATRDGSSSVRQAAISALGGRRATAWRAVLRERLDDAGEDPDVRAVAAQALGLVCDAVSLEQLTKWSHELGAIGGSDDTRRISAGALAGLAALHPRDLKERLAPLLAETAPSDAHRAAERAIRAAGVCTWKR